MTRAPQLRSAGQAAKGFMTPHKDIDPVPDRLLLHVLVAAMTAINSPLNSQQDPVTMSTLPQMNRVQH